VQARSGQKNEKQDKTQFTTKIGGFLYVIKFHFWNIVSMGMDREECPQNLDGVYLQN
jgi:hypothetical protein